MKKVLYISYDGMTDPLGQSQVLPYLRGLSKLGYQFTILSFEKDKQFTQFGELIRSQCNEAGIQWVPLKFHTSPPVLSKIYDRRKLFSTAKRLHAKEKFDLFHCRSYIASEIGLLFKKKYGVKFLFDMRGFWADEKAESGHWNQQKWLYRKIYNRYKSLEKDFVTGSDHIISLTEAGRQALGKLYNGSLAPATAQDKCTVIPCCADLDHFNYSKYTEEQRAELRKQLGIDPAAPVLTYSGSLGDWYLVDDMLQLFKSFRQKHPNAVFLCLTRETDRLKEGMENNGIDPASVVTGFSSYAQLPVYLSLGQYSMFFIKPIFSKTASSPTKHAELMGMGIPVFCNDIGDTGFFLRNYPLGELVDINKKDFAAAVNRMDERKTNKQEIREVALQYFDVKVGVERYRSVYDQLLKP